MLELIGEVASKTVETVGEVAKEAEKVSVHAAELGKEVNEAALHELESGRTIVVTPDMVVIKELSLHSVMLNNMEGISQKVSEAKLKETADDGEGISTEKVGLTEDEKSKIIEETGWSSKIVDCIESMEQYEIYKNAGLHETEIDGRKCLVKDIDMDYVDPKTGLTNRELMEKGRAPIDAKTGEPIELHHMGQDFNSPFAELCANSEHGDGKDAILHDKKIESWRQDPEKKNQYNNVQRPNHWKARAREV